MRLFRSIFMAVVLISPTLAWGEETPEIDWDTMSVYEICNQESVSGSRKKLCDYINIEATNKLSDEEEKEARMNCNNPLTCSVYFDDRYYYECTYIGLGYRCEEGFLVDATDDVASTPVSAASDAPVSETVAAEESKKSDDENTKSTDASDKKNVSHTFSVSESVNDLSGLTKKVAAEAAYRQYLESKYCDGSGIVDIRSDTTQIMCSNGWASGTQPTDSSFTSEHKTALCYAECAGKEREYVSGTYGKCECSVTRAEKRAANQQARDERKAARAEDRAARQEERADERAARQEERKKEKAIECDGRNPPMDIKQNDLGLWVCVDTDETIKKREEERKTNKTLDAFWNEMEDLERAFNKRVRQLQRQAKKDGGAK